jgi:bacterioferritin-associated ferredoxin
MELDTSSPDCRTVGCGGECRGCRTVGSCPDRLVCRCLGVTEEVVIAAITTLGVRTLQQLKEVTEAGTGCRCCLRQLHNYLVVYSSSSAEICSAR